MLTLIDDARVRETLHKIVTTLTANRALQDDLMQECLIHIWRAENQTPGHTRSWYLQNCRYHVLHWLSAGRSLDSLKRTNGDQRVSIDELDDCFPFDGYHTHGELLAEVCANDVISTLALELKPSEIAVLRGLADGMRLHEIAVKLKRSYPTVLSYRRKIARVAVKLGFYPAFRPIQRARRITVPGPSVMRENRRACSLRTRPREALLRTTTQNPAIEAGSCRARPCPGGNVPNPRGRTLLRSPLRKLRTAARINRGCYKRQ